MKMMFVVVLAMVAAVAAAPQGPPLAASAFASVGAPVNKETARILRSNFDQQPEGGYSLDFETDDGTVRQERGELKEVVDEENKPHSVVVVRGMYTFIDSDGKPQTVSYFADETGFHAEGDAIPKPAR